MRPLLRCFALLLFASSGLSTTVHASTVTFDTYTAGTSITTQYAGLAVTGGTVIAPGILNPVHSGSQELSSGAGQPLSLSFATGQSSVSGYYTAGSPVTVSIFANRSTTPASSVLLQPGLLQTAFAITGSNITKLVLTPTLGSVTLDDLSYATPASAATPEPASLLLMGTGLCLCSLLPAWRASHRRAALA